MTHATQHTAMSDTEPTKEDIRKVVELHKYDPAINHIEEIKEGAKE